MPRATSWPSEQNDFWRCAVMLADEFCIWIARIPEPMPSSTIRQVIAHREFIRIAPRRDRSAASGFRRIRTDTRRYRVRLNGVDHQWGKDPPKEVVG